MTYTWFKNSRNVHGVSVWMRPCDHMQGHEWRRVHTKDTLKPFQSSAYLECMLKRDPGGTESLPGASGMASEHCFLVPADCGGAACRSSIGRRGGPGLSSWTGESCSWSGDCLLEMPWLLSARRSKIFKPLLRAAGCSICIVDCCIMHIMLIICIRVCISWAST